MANGIAKFKRYVPLLDEVFSSTALTAVLDSDPSIAREGSNVNEIIIPMLDMDGLGDYDRSKANAYAEGGVRLTTQSKKFNYERGRMFIVDNIDDEESAGLAFGRLASEFIRTKVVPEVDAVRFAYAVAKTPAGGRVVHASFTDGVAVQKALAAAMTQMDEKEVPQEERYLFIMPVLAAMLDCMESYQSKAMLERFQGIVKVPQSRFYSAVELLSGADTDADRAGGYTKADGATEVNFLIAHKPALIQFTKHVAPKVITPEQNQTADAWKFGYRIYSLYDAYDNKLDGLYVSTKSAVQAG